MKAASTNEGNGMPMRSGLRAGEAALKSICQGGVIGPKGKTCRKCQLFDEAGTLVTTTWDCPSNPGRAYFR
jgi:hypothetical protein